MWTEIECFHVGVGGILAHTDFCADVFATLSGHSNVVLKMISIKYAFFLKPIRTIVMHMADHFA